MDSTAFEPIDFSQWIPLFPLPGVVLMPRAVLPLHVFEPRYRAMTRDALEGPRLVAAALLRPGYEGRYHTLTAEIETVVCVGGIIRCEPLADGRFNILLQGLTRARVVEERNGLGYRQGKLERVPVVETDPHEACEIRAELRRILEFPPISHLAVQGNWWDLMRCPDMCISNLVDLLASLVIRSPEDKQAFLNEPRLAVRAQRLIRSLAALSDLMSVPIARGPVPRRWPPVMQQN